MEQLFSRHTKIAFEFSGGKDSLALAGMLLKYREKLTVYWCNTGDVDPETVASVESVKRLYPHFVTVTSDVVAFKKQFGLPSPVVPINSEVKIISDQLCCMHNIMIPLHSRVIADGNTCIIRGQKDSDRHKGQLAHGEVHEGVEYIYPLAGNTDDEVFQYLESEGIKPPAVYAYSNHGIDCLRCSGWWEHKHLGYLKDHFPLSYKMVKRDRQTITAAVLQELYRADH